MSSLSLISRLTGNADITDQNSIFFEATQPALSELPASFILTHRLGEPIFSTFTAEELWVEAPTQASTVGVTIIASDDDNLTAADKPVDMTSEGDVLWDDTTWGGGTWQANKRRERPAGAAIVAKHFQLKIYAVNALNRAWRFVRAALFSEKRFGRW
jgi:hypothetical protein